MRAGGCSIFQGGGWGDRTRSVAVQPRGVVMRESDARASLRKLLSPLCAEADDRYRCAQYGRLIKAWWGGEDRALHESKKHDGHKHVWAAGSSSSFVRGGLGEEKRPPDASTDTFRYPDCLIGYLSLAGMPIALFPTKIRKFYRVSGRALAAEGTQAIVVLVKHVSAGLQTVVTV